MFLVDRPNIIYIYGENALAAGWGLHGRITSGPRGILMFGPENAIFVDDPRYSGGPGREGPVGRVARVTPNRSFCVRVLKLFGTAVRHPLAPSGASTEVPRRISLGFAHSTAAAGDRRRGGLYAACSCWQTVCVSCELLLVHADPAKVRNIIYIYNEIIVRQRSADSQGVSTSQN